MFQNRHRPTNNVTEKRRTESWAPLSIMVSQCLKQNSISIRSPTPCKRKSAAASRPKQELWKEPEKLEICTSCTLCASHQPPKLFDTYSNVSGLEMCLVIHQADVRRDSLALTEGEFLPRQQGVQERAGTCLHSGESEDRDMKIRDCQVRF